MHHADLQRLARGEIRQQPRQPRGEHGFAAAGRADHQHVMPAGRRDLQRAPRGFHAAHIGEVQGFVRRRPASPGGGAEKTCVPRKWLIRQSRSGAASTLRSAGPARFGALRLRADQPQLAPGRGDGRRQHAGHRVDPAIQR